MSFLAAVHVINILLEKDGLISIGNESRNAAWFSLKGIDFFLEVAYQLLTIIDATQCNSWLTGCSWVTCVKILRSQLSSDLELGSTKLYKKTRRRNQSSFKSTTNAEQETK